MKSRRVAALSLICEIIAPIVVGGVIYILWRPTSLLLFSWLRVLHLYKPVTALRLVVHSASPNLIGWWLFSLPAGLWMYSFVAALGIIWSSGPIKWFWFWTSGALLIGIGSEFSQLFGILSGRFDVFDLVTYFGAWSLAIYSASKRREHA